MNSYNYHASRARRARLGKVLGHKAVYAFFHIFALLFLATGIYLLIQKSPLAWLCFGFAIFLALPPYWIRHDLVELPKDKTDSLENRLSRELLVRLPKNPDTKAILTESLECQSAIFLENRYGIVAPLIDILVPASEIKPEVLFAKASEIATSLNLPEVDGGTVIVASIELTPNYEKILKSLKLDLPALYGGISWYYYLVNLTKNYRKYKNTGGIARDLSFGYANLLSRFAENISQKYVGNYSPSLNIASHKDNVEQMIDIFSGKGRQNVALIGANGSGRSNIVENFASEILNSKTSEKLRFRQIFRLDAAALVASASGRGQIEGLMNEIFNEVYAAKNIILWLDNAEVFFEDQTGAIDISNLLIPILENGAIRIILTIDEQHFLEASSKNPRFTNSINRIMVQAANHDETIAVLQDQSPYFEYKSQHAIITYWALEEAYRLGSKYIKDLVMPGQALTLLEMAANYAEEGFVTDKSVQQAVEKNFGIKMQSTQSATDKKKLLDLENELHKRLIGQDSAVKAVSDSLRRSAAGVRNQNRPIGTFIFLGPTGVGKTELAKALSETYFNGEQNVIRIDLNEYVKEEDVSRLIADASEYDMSLTAQISKQPFAVVLLDEIEKAHPKVLTALLQLLDEGILRDTKNHEVSFRDAIIIATSNAGANQIRDYLSSGKKLDEVKDILVEQLIHDGEFKPEFLNRFDEICVFEPLEKDDLMKIIDLIIASVNDNLSSQKITINVDNDAKALLVEKGYDPKLGARPMRRIVQKTVENIIAKRVLAGDVSSGAEIQISKQDIIDQLEK